MVCKGDGGVYFLSVISFLLYGVTWKREPVTAINVRNPYLTSSYPSPEKCIIYGPEPVMRNGYVMKLTILLINFI